MKAIDIYATVPELTEEKEDKLNYNTLEEVAAATNIPVEYFIEKLKLNANDKNKMLGSLKEKYGFEVDDVRKLIGYWELQNEK